MPYVSHNTQALDINTKLRYPRFAMPKITNEDLRQSIAQASDRVKKRLEVIEPKIFSNGMLKIL
jgi:hypothetical protein